MLCPTVGADSGHSWLGFHKLTNSHPLLTDFSDEVPVFVALVISGLLAAYDTSKFLMQFPLKRKCICTNFLFFRETPVPPPNLPPTFRSMSILFLEDFPTFFVRANFEKNQRVPHLLRSFSVQ